MPALKPTQFSAEVTWLGSVYRTDLPTLMSDTADKLDLTFEGIAGTRHFGNTRSSCVRVTAQYPKGTPIGNERQLSILSAEELEQIAAQMGLDDIDPARLGASMVIRGIPDFTHVPPSSRLLAPSGASLVIDMENRPCQIPAKLQPNCLVAALPGCPVSLFQTRSFPQLLSSPGLSLPYLLSMSNLSNRQALPKRVES